MPPAKGFEEGDEEYQFTLKAIFAKQAGEGDQSRECGSGRMQTQRPCLPIGGTFDIISTVRKLVRKLTGRKESRQVKGSKT